MRTRLNLLLKIVFPFAVSLIAHCCFAQTSYDVDELTAEFLNSKLDSGAEKSSIPKSFIRQLNRDRSRRITFTTRSEEFNRTDIDDGKQPNSQLIVVGKSEKLLYAILYWAGGYGTHKRAFIAKKLHGLYIIGNFPVDPSVANLDQLKNYVRRNPSIVQKIVR